MKLVILAAVIAVVQGHNLDIVVQTGDHKEAGTDSEIRAYALFKGSLIEYLGKLDKSGYDDFKIGSTETYKMKSHYLSDPTELQCVFLKNMSNDILLVKSMSWSLGPASLSTSCNASRWIRTGMIIPSLYFCCKD